MKIHTPIIIRSTYHPILSILCRFSYFQWLYFHSISAKAKRQGGDVVCVQKDVPRPNFAGTSALMCRFVFYVEQFLSNVILINLKEEMTERLKGLANTQSLNEKLQQTELLALVTFVKRAPNSIQRHLLPYLFDLRREFPSDSRVKHFHQTVFAELEYRPQPTPSGQALLRTLLRILQLKIVPTTINKIIERVQAERAKQITRGKQQILGKGAGFQRLDLLHCEYDTFYKMSRQERSHHLPQHHSKNKVKNFYADPRYLVRIEEYAHFKSNEKHKGDILFLNYQGNIITGSKAYAVARDRQIEHWEMTSNAYPTPQLNIPSENTDGDKKEDEEKKEKEIKTEPPSGTKFCLNHVFTGHQEKITCLSFSQDQYYLLSGSADRSIKLWCLRLRTCLSTHKGHQKTIWDVHFNPSGYYFLSGAADGCMILWKTDEPHAQRVYYHKGDVNKVSFAKDPSFVISAGQDCSVKIWNTLEATIVQELRLGKPVINFHLGFSGSLIVTVENDGRISIHDMLKGEVVNSFYFYEDKKGKEGNTEIAKMKVHDVCLSEDERELCCVTSKYVVIYSMDRLEMKVNNNIYTFFEGGAESNKVTRLPPKEIVYMGIDTNLTFCSYQHKNVLVVAGSSKT